jgi:hypothetical protein
MRLIIYCISAFLLIVSTASSAHAEEPFSVLGVYQTRGDVMGILVANDLEHKAAGFVVDVVQLNKPKVRVTVAFGATDWQEFAQIWHNARRAALPREGFGTEIGHYFDPATNAGVTVTVHKDGVITFAIAGKPKGDLVACLIDIEPKDFARFDETANKLTAYFKD